jgi:hypothetical protein
MFPGGYNLCNLLKYIVLTHCSGFCLNTFFVKKNTGVKNGPGIIPLSLLAGCEAAIFQPLLFDNPKSPGRKNITLIAKNLAQIAL